MENYYLQTNRKAVINVAFVGSRSSGKSTTIGHLLYSTGNINQNFFEIRKRSARETYGEEYKYAWLLDNNWHECTYRKTLQIHLKRLQTQKHDFNLIDLPGDFHLRKTIFKGLSLADAAVLIVSADSENDKNEHIKDDLILAYTLGIRQLILAFNKMDKTKDIKYSEKRFMQLKKQMLTLSKTVGFDINNIQFIPYSGYTGQNLVERYEDESNGKLNKMEWYKGKTLLESLDELKSPKRDLDGPLKISIFYVDKISGIGTVLEGKILSGKLVKDMDIYVPTAKGIQKLKCNSIEIHYQTMPEAVAGDIIGFRVRGICRTEAYDHSRLVFSESVFKTIQIAHNLRVKILMLNKNIALKAGSDLCMFCYTLKAAVKIRKIEYIIDDTNKILEREPKEIRNGGYVIMILDLKKNSYEIREHFFEKYMKNPILGSIALFNKDFIAVGSIQDINV